jgi:imidazolonepropionase-like amidohydrolase
VHNERADPTEPAYLLRNATIYTGNGEVIEGGDVLVRHGLIERVSRKTGEIKVGKEVEVIDVGRRWLTPGIVDVRTGRLRGC